MRSQEIARRYAAALYQVSAEDAAVREIEDELAAVAVGTSDESETRRFLAHPLVPREQKSEFLAAAFPETSDRMRNFLELLIRNRRETYLDLIYDAYVDIRTTAEGMIQVSVTTTVKLSDEDRSRLIERLEHALNRPVQLEESIDARMLGGARIEADGHVLDGTIRARLGELRRQLEE
ncbi:ATP synthase F1 subunit delta [Candidatus Bipolaricaulota bacterium]|nr:ATP synthase F1 subunit delta [Candidatus Bipolaricaulota bacterium]